MTSATTWRSIVYSHLLFYVYDYVHRHHLGLVIMNVGHEILPKVLVTPDISFTSKKRLPKSNDLYIQVAPDFAIEIPVLGASMRQMEQKVALYFRGGTQLVWVVFPFEHIVDVYLPGFTPFRHTEEHILDCGDVLPGFTLAVKDIFPA